MFRFQIKDIDLEISIKTIIFAQDFNHVLMTQHSQALKFSRKGAKFQYIGKLRVTVIASTLRLRAASHRPELAEDKRSSCAKGLRFNMQEQAKLKL